MSAIDNLVLKTCCRRSRILRAFRKRAARDGERKAALWVLAIWANVPALREAHAMLSALVAEQERMPLVENETSFDGGPVSRSLLGPDGVLPLYGPERELRALSYGELMRAQGFQPIAPINHDSTALKQHLAHRPSELDPNAFSGPVRVGWTSPECSHFAGRPASELKPETLERIRAASERFGLAISGERFAAIWEKRGPQNNLSGRLTDAEDALVAAHWKTLGGDSCWDDAFHALWRKTDPDGHAKLFSGSFYATAESMRADDDDEDGGSR